MRGNLCVFIEKPTDARLLPDSEERKRESMLENTFICIYMTFWKTTNNMIITKKVGFKHKIKNAPNDVMRVVWGQIGPCLSIQPHQTYK